MKVLGKVTLGLAAVAVAALCWDWSVEPASGGTPSANPTGPAPGADPAKANVGTERALERTDVTRPNTDEGTDGDPPAPPPAKLRGRVIDVHGTGIAGVSLSVGDSGAGGAFECSPAAGVDNIVSTDPRWATVRAGSTRIQAPNLSTVIIAPRIELGGRVVDSDGQPLPEAKVKVHLPSYLAVDLGILLDGSVNVTWLTDCDHEGRFVLRDVPAVAQAELSSTLGGYLPRFVELPQQSTELLELVLDRPEVGAAVVEGLVVDVFGAAVAGARVSAGGKVSRTDDRGAFMIDLSNEETLDRIVAIAKGMQPAVHVPERDATGQLQWPARVTLRLGQAPLSITGQVIDRDRRPVEGAKVWIDDPLVVGFDGDSALLAETLLGRKDRPFWAFVLTDSSGTFRLDGLLDRAYVVRALDPSTLMAMTQDEVQAGSSGVELQLASDTYPELRGRVVSHDGSAISGVSVRLMRPALAVQIPGGPDSSMFEWTSSTPVKTNQAGEFALRNVPTEGVQLQASGDTIQTVYNWVRPGMDPMAFVLRAERRIRLQVELATPTDRADEVRVLRATGRNMLLQARGSMNFKWALLDGRTEVLSLGEGAQTAVFFKDGVEVGRMPVRLQFDQVNTIRF